MFVSNDLRIYIKGFTILVFIIGIYFPVVTVNVEVESTDNLLDPFDDEYMVIYSNKIQEGSIDDSDDMIIYNKIETNKFLSYLMLFLLMFGIAILTGSLYTNLMEKETKFFGEWQATIVGYIALLILFAIIFLKITLLKSDLQTVNGKSLLRNIKSSRGDVSFYINVKESIYYTMMQISLLSYAILPITNKLLKERN